MAVTDNGFESVVPSTPRSGQYVPVLGYTSNENGGVVVELTECESCHAAVNQAFLNEHMATHETAAPPESGPKSAR